MAIGLAILGAGIFAREEYLPAILCSGRFDLRAIYSRSQEAAEHLATVAGPGVTAYFDDPDAGHTLDALLARQDIHAIISAVPFTAQLELIQKALDAGKHVLSEKPIAADVTPALQGIERHALRPGTIWGVAENFRFIEPFAAGYQALKDLGGEVVTFRVALSMLIDENDKFFRTSWRKTPEYVGGFLLDGGIHWVAGLRYLLEAAGQSITRISAFTTLLQPRLAPLDTVNAVLKITNERSGTLSMSYGMEHQSSVEIDVTTTNGSVSVTPVGVTVTKKGAEGKMQKNALDFEFGSGVDRELEAFANSIETRQVDARLDPSQALADLELLHALLQSGEEMGNPVDI